MNITTKLKEDLKKYGINLPTDKRTRAYQQQVRIFRIEEAYIQHLRGLVKTAKAKETKQVKKLKKKSSRCKVSRRGIRRFKKEI